DATIAGGMFANKGFTVAGEIRALAARIGSLSMNGATLANPDGDALSLDNATITGDLFAYNGFTATGEIRAPGANISGQLSMNGATLTNPAGNALLLDNATITSGMFLADGFTAIGQVRAPGTNISGQLSLTGATLTNPDGIALSLDDATITGGLFASDGFTATGEIRAVAARIGQLSMNGAALTNPDGNALLLDNATISSGLFLDNRFTATGEIRALGARINGELSMSGATLTNPDGDALSLDRATITGDVFLDHGFTASGQIRGLGMKIDGQLSLTGATLTNPDGDALSLDRATITGELFADDGFTASGRVRAPGANIGTLSVHGATFTNAGGNALDLESSIISTLRLMPARVDGTVNLLRATITDLRTPSDISPPGRLIATGWQITDVHGLIRTDRRAATRWLKATPPGHGFTAQPWHVLAAVYDRNGQPADARRVRFTAANQTTAHAPRYTKPLRWIYLTVAGHGYYPLLASAWLAGALVLGYSIAGHNTKYFIPTDRAAASKTAAAYASATNSPSPQTITAADDCASYPDYPCFNAFNYALGGVVPPATGVLKADWTISSNGPIILTLGIPALRILGWILTAVLLAGVTGLLRKG
ncbi:hypothetical protein, partial [Nocardia jejuensis]|uniref:hypothetical protein n=1 Tax=Nocardia jejuensis TaxID=328049 RepID=UPI00082FEAD9